MLNELLANPSFLPLGGNLGFGLRHQYPISYDQGICTAAEDSHVCSDYETESAVLPRLEKCLKGWDASIMRVCTNLGLSPHLRIIYKTENALVMCDKVYYQFEGQYGEEMWVEWG